MSTTTTTSEWSVTTDIYDIVSQVNDLKAKYIDADETTLAVGIFGFLGDTESKKIQTAVIETGELGNEMFPQRAKFDKNIVTHAIYCNIGNLNATPAYLTMNIAIKETDLETYISDGKFTFDCTCPLYVGDYEFHLEYDLVLSRSEHNGKYVYNAYYDMTDTNNLSGITNPYIGQPYLANFNNYSYIFFQVTVRQYTIETTQDTMVTNSVIDNKSFTFSFSNQLADFDVYITEDGVTTRLTPLMYGAAVETGVTDYCWYLYMSDDSIRIGFDQSSYLPGLNATVKVVAKTCVGASGNFTYTSSTDDDGFYIDFESSLYNYKTITCYATCATSSTEGTDKKTTDELKALIPKMALSRGYITTETDLNGYFNLISTDENRLKLQKKVDNQLNRIWYCYLVAKDDDENIIPTNTLPIQVALTDKYIETDKNVNGRYIVPCGTTFMYDPTVGYCTYIDPSKIPTIYSGNYYGSVYYYRTIHNMIINIDPLYCAYYNTIVNIDSYFEYYYVNTNMDMGFIANTNHFERSLLSNTKEYRLTFSVAQSVNEDYGLVKATTDAATGVQTITTNLMKVFLIIYKDSTAYRYVEAKLTSWDSSNYISTWEVKLTTDDGFDTLDRLKLLNLHEAGLETTNYGYFDDNSEAHIAILGNFGTEYGRDKIESIIPNQTGYSLVNIYKLSDGLTLFRNFTSVMNTRIRGNTNEDSTAVINYNISGIPMVGEHFFISESNVTYLMDTLASKKAYIDYCLTVLENNMNIDFKFYNTYGYSNTYYAGYSATIGTTSRALGNIDTTWNFRMQLVNSNDSTTKDSIIAYIKDYIEDMNNSGDLHVTNLLHDIKENYSSLITYIEFINFNDNNLGVNHILLSDDIDSNTVPEFICVRNNLASDGTTLTPDISIEVISS